LREEQRRRTGPRRLGIGVSTYVEVTNGLPEGEFGEVEITGDGGAILRTGSFSHGQGHETTFAMIVAERLGLPLAAVTVVKVDIETGAVELLRLIAVDDAGTIISPVIAEGQVQGGLATGVAQALYEEVVYDEDGNPFTLGFVNYESPSANDLPSFELHGM